MAINVLETIIAEETVILNAQNFPSLETNLKVPKFGVLDYTIASNLLEVIQTDLAGPMSVHTIEGALHFLSLTDDKSRFIRVYLVKHKIDALAAFRTYHNQAVNLHRRPILRLQSDLGSEFLANNLKAFCNEK